MTDRSFEASLVTKAVLLSAVVAVQWGMVPTLTVPTLVYASGPTRSSSPGPCATTRPRLPSGVNDGRCGEAPTGDRAASRVVSRAGAWTAAAPAAARHNTRAA